ncbi:VC0807 family protein [Pseudonocardia sp. CA-107938]|uniref:VC0807 family protein n=1 Tax=Pseudonocardia sp. CA-107938 TaxID=3240021 RepID=UPI003D8D2C3C
MNAKLRAVLPMLVDVVVPVAGYYLLSACGLDDFWALTIAGLATAVHALVTTVRRRRLDGFGALVVLEIALSLVLLGVTRDPRIVLLKPSFYTALAGVFLIGTCLAGKPFTLDVTRPMAVGGDPRMAAAVDAAAAPGTGYHREHLRLTAVWAAIWLVESVVRGWIVLQTDVATGVLVSQVPGLVALVVGIAYSRSRVPALRRHVAEYAAVSASGTPASPTRPGS